MNSIVPKLLAVTTANNTPCSNSSNSKASRRDTRAAVFILNGPRWHLHECLEKEAIGCKRVLLLCFNRTILALFCSRPPDSENFITHQLLAGMTTNSTLCNNHSNSKASRRDTRAAVFILNGPRWHLHECLEKETVNCKGMLLQHSSKTIGVPASPN